jgi:hypothetical protein
VFLSAQEPAQSQPPGKPGTPTVTYLSDWRAQDPPRYSISVDSSGRATYHSEPAANPNGGSAPEPYFVEWTATEPTRSRIFELAQKTNYFEGNFTSKAKVADTGLKTLRYQDQARDHSASYNYSENPAVRELTEIFQSIEATAEMGRKLQYDARYSKLAIDQDLKYLQQAQRGHEAIEFGSVEPILQQIAGDTSMLRMAQQRAAQILKMAGLPVEQAQK